MRTKTIQEIIDGIWVVFSKLNIFYSINWKETGIYLQINCLILHITQLYAAHVIEEESLWI